MKAYFAKLPPLNLVRNTNKAGPSGHAGQILRPFAAAHPYFYFYSCNWDQKGSTVSADPRRDSVETLISSSVSDAIFFLHFPHFSSLFGNNSWWLGRDVINRLASWMHHCGQIWPHCQATSHKTCNVYSSQENTWRSLGKVAKVFISPSNFVLH